MDGFSVAASVIAVIQISSQIFDLCRTYYINVRDARKDIERLRSEISSLQDVLVNAFDLANSPNFDSMPSLKLICQEGGLMQQCQLELKALAAKIYIGGMDNTMRQFGLKSLKWPLTSKEVDKALLTIERHKVSLTLTLATDQRTLSLAIQHDLSEMRQQFEAQMIDDDRQAIIRWLSTTDPAINHHAACLKCQPETGKWLLDRADFQKWKAAQNSLIWLYGIPGSGKTILSSTIIQYLQIYVNKNPADVVAYFYFDFNNISKQEVLHCLSSLVAQLCSHLRIVPEYMEELYKRSNYGKQQPNLSELKQTLFKIVENFDNVFIIIDALDECRRTGEREQLFAVISDIKSRSLLNLHLLVTSRRESDIESAMIPLVSLPAISVGGSQVDLDIKLHVSWQLATDPILKKWPKSVKEEIQESLTAGANGMFRWVACQLDALKRCLKVSMIRKELKALPRTLDETYTRLFLEIDQSYRQDAKRALLWLAFSGRPLQVKELAEAIVINPLSNPPFDPEERFPDPQSVFKILSSLITISSEWNQEIISSSKPQDIVDLSETVTLAHFSVMEYLISDRIQNSSARDFAAADTTAHHFIAECCLEYILYYASSTSKSESFDDLCDFPLLNYAARYWYRHINLATYEKQMVLTPLALELLLSNSFLSSWLLVHRPESPTMEAFENVVDARVTNTALFYASDMGLLPVIQSLLKSGWDPNIASADRETPLHRAVIRGHQGVVLTLLDSGADVNTEDVWGGTPLLYAVENGNVAIVQILLMHGAKVNTTNGPRWGPLHAAAYNNFDQIAVLLLENGAAVDNRMELTNQTALHWAAWRDNELLVDLLVKYGADINAKNNYGESALHYAARHGDIMLHHLLKKGADVEVQTDCGETPLYWAVTNVIGVEKKAPEALMEAGAKISVPLLISARKGDHTTLHQLLSNYPKYSESISVGRKVLEETDARGFDLCSECRDRLA